MDGTILVAEDEALPRKNICRVLAEEGYQVHQAADGKEAIEAVDKMDFDLVLTDIQMPGADGLAVLKHVREVAPQTFVTIMTAYASVDTVVTALQLGAQDYLLKPIVFDDLLRKVNLLMEHKHQAWEIQMLRREVNRHFDLDELVGSSPAIQKVSGLIEKVAPAEATILITGESGVGEGLGGGGIHGRRLCKKKIFFAVHFSAIS